METLINKMQLTKNEKQHVALFVACQALRKLQELTDEPLHTRRQRKLMALVRSLMQHVGPQIPGIGKPRDVFQETLRVSNQVRDEILTTSSMKAQILLNLALYCLGKTPATYKQYEILDELFILWGVEHSPHTNDSGRRVFIEIEEQTALAMIKQKGVIL
jgi:hypothetical protein